MTPTQLATIRQMEKHLFEAHPQRILDLLYDRTAFIDTRETCPHCDALLRSLRRSA